MRRSWVPYALLGILLYGVFLSTFAPSTWVAWGVTRISHGTVTLSDARGTFWSGDGALSSVRQRDLGRLRWRINPVWLFGGRIAATLDLSGPGTRLSTRLRVGFGGLQIHEATARFSPAVVAAFYPPLTLADPTGNMELHATNVSLTGNAIEGDANLLWRSAATNMSGVRPLGNYQLQLIGKRRTVDVTLTTQGGSLDLTGQGRWQPFDGGQFEFSGVARAAAQQTELAPLLALLGAQQTPGEVRLLIRTAFILR